MNIIDRLALKSEWERYYSYKLEQGNISEKDAVDLHDFIVGEEYLPVVQKILDGKSLSPPEKKLIGKSGSKKKRAVYTYSRAENYVLKLIAFLLREYDSVFAPNLYSFRKDMGVKTAINRLMRIRGLYRHYVYKVDISNYFNSVDVQLLMPSLAEVLSDEPELYEFIRGLLKSTCVISDGQLISESKGIMAGVPISGFLANLFLSDMDFYFCRQNITYMRYSDDIIVFAGTREELDGYIAVIKDTLANHHLVINESKEIISQPGEQWSFLGFSFMDGVIDICPVSFCKLKAKMRRKTRALARWASRKGVSGQAAARAFVNKFNAKLYDNPVYSELTWTRWFFPVINTDKTLAQIDSYMLECIRYLATGKRTKGRFSFRYEDIKALGYRSLVNEYYRQKKSG